MESNRRQHRQNGFDERFNIVNWKDFTSYMMPLSFPQNIESFSEQEIQDIWVLKCQQLIENSEKAFLMCKPETKQKIVRAGINIISRIPLKFQNKLDYDYQSLFLGNKKQLLIYKMTNSIQLYLRKYRLPNNYPKLKDQIDRIQNKIDEIVIRRNVDICLDRPVSDIDELTDKIECMRKKQLEKPLGQFKKLIGSMFEDFISQPKRSEIVLSLLRKSHLPFIKQLCNQHELYWNRRYTDGPKDQRYMDVQIIKHEHIDKYAFQPQQYPQIQQVSIAVPQQKQKTIVKPGEIKEWAILRYKKDQADVLVDLPDITKSFPLDRVFLIDGLGNQSLVFEQKQESRYPDEFSILIKAYHKGYCQYRLATQNSAGRTLSKKIKIFFQDDDAPKKLFILGNGQETYLIPNTKRKSEDQPCEQDFYKTTQEQFIHVLNCYDVSFGTCAFSIFGSKKQSAAWGSVYLSSVVVNQAQIHSMSMTKVNRKIQKPCMIEQASNLRRISAGLDYCLATDKAGKIWSYGVNHVDQLGHGANCKKLGSERFQLAEQFIGSGIFFVDVKATKSGGSIAIDKQGQLYRWGLNQVQKTNFPIIDSYSNVINYKTFQQTKQKSSIAYPLNKKYIYNPVKEIHVGHSFYLALTQKNELYGWGKYEQLGLGSMKDIITDKIDYLCNPIELMNKVKVVATGQNHTVVIKEDNTVLAWGRSDCFISDAKKHKIIDIPVKIDVNAQTLKNIECGPDFTVFLHQQNNEQYIDVIGCRQVFKKGHYLLPGKTTKVVCGEKLISLLI